MNTLNEGFEARFPSRSSHAARPRSPRLLALKPQLFALEPRMLFDGAVAATADAAIDPRFAETTGGDPRALESQAAGAVSVASTETPLELLVIDPTVADWQSLAGSARPGVRVLVLDPQADGLMQIARAVGSDHSFGAIHVLSHGAGDGRMQLGTRVIDADNLSAYASQLADISQGLTANGDLLLYGCDIGDAFAGMRFLQAIAQATGADVAASNDATGARALGGDWILETKVGEVEAGGVIADAALDGYQHLLSAQPTVSLGAPVVSGAGVTSDLLLGESFQMTAVFSNGGSSNGFGGYVDLFVPAQGADGGASPDGVSITGATLGGVALSQTVITLDADDIASGTVAHPFYRNSLGGDLVSVPAGMQAGDQLIVFQLPAGGYAPGQAASEVVISGVLSANADPGAALRVSARAGFQYGQDPLDNPAADPSVEGAMVSQDLNPVVFRVYTTYIGPEGETATGNNYLRAYRIDVDIADGQTLDTFDLSSMLSGSSQFEAIVGTPSQIGGHDIGASPTGSWSNVAGALVSHAASEIGGAPPSPGGTVTREIASITGTAAGADASMVVQFYIPQLDGAANPVIDAVTGDAATITTGVAIAANWTPSDPRDAVQSMVASAPNAGTISAESVSIQETRTITSDVGALGLSSGDIVRFTLDVQVSDFFALGGNPGGTDLLLTDTLSDGFELLDSTTTPSSADPTLVVVRSGGAPETYTLTPGVNYTVSVDPQGNQTIVFNLRSTLPVPGDGQLLIGDLFNDGIVSGATTARVEFDARVLEQYRVGAPTINGVPQQTSPTMRLVDGDLLVNGAVVQGTVLDAALDPLAPALDKTCDDTQLIETINARAVMLLVATSQDDTSGTQVAVGEVVRYRMVVQLPEGVNPDLQLIPNLSTGLHMLNDGTITVALVSQGGMTSSTLAGGTLAQVGGGDWAGEIAHIVPQFVLPGAAIVDPLTGTPLAAGMLDSGMTAGLRLGSVTNNDADGDAEFVVVEFNAVVNNEFGVASGAVLSAMFSYDIGAPTSVDMSNMPQIEVVEPLIASVDKHVVAISGSQVTFEVIFANTGTQNAEDVRIVDDFAGATNISFGGAGGVSGLPAGASNNSTATALDLTLPTLAIGESVTIRYAATVADPTQAVPAYAVTVTYTSLSDTGSDGRTLVVSTDSGPATSTTTGERSGNPADYGGALNVYQVSEPEALGTISGTLWDDTCARNGAIDGAETFLANVQVTLTWAGRDNAFGTSDDSVVTQMTSATGAYAFGGLGAGNYRIGVPAGQTALGAGTPLIDPVSGSVTVVHDTGGVTMTDGSQDVTLAEGAAVVQRDFGYVQINDAPTVAGPVSLGAIEAVPLAFTGGNTISVADVDADQCGVTTSNVATLNVAHGTLTVSAAGGALVTGNGGALMSITGSLADINATLATLTYTSDALYQGADTLTVRIDDLGNTGDADGDGVPTQPADNLFDQQSIAITVLGVNHPPVANDDGRATDPLTPVGGQSIAPDGAQQAAGDFTDTDPDLGFGDTLTVQGVQFGSVAGPLTGGVGAPLAGAYGTLVLAPDGSYTYAPGPAAAALAGGVVVSDVYTYTINDQFGQTATATITITITGVNQPPVAVADTRSTNTETPGPLQGNVVTALAIGDQSDFDPNTVDPLAVQGVQAGDAGGATLSGMVDTPVNGQYGVLTLSANGTYTYVLDLSNPTVATLGATQTLTDVFTYTINDGQGGTSTTTLTITITGPEQPPAGTDKVFQLTEDTSQPLTAADFGFSDPDPTSTFAAVRIDTLPDSGELLLDGQAVVAGQVIPFDQLALLSYLPAPGANSATLAQPPSLQFSVQDNTGRFDPVPNTFTFLIDPANDPPLAPSIVRTIDANATAGSDAARILDMPAPTDPDIPAQTLSVVIDALPPAANGVFLNADGTPVTVGQAMTVQQLQNLSFVPAPGFSAPVDAQGLMSAGALQYHVSDPDGASASGSIGINIRPPAVAPPPPPAPPPFIPGPPGPPPIPEAPPPTIFLRSPPPPVGEMQLPHYTSARSDFDPFSPIAVNAFSPIREAVAPTSGDLDPQAPPRRGSNVRGVADEQDDESVKPKAKVKVKVKVKPKALERAGLGETGGGKVVAASRSFSEQLKIARKPFKPPAKIAP